MARDFTTTDKNVLSVLLNKSALFISCFLTLFQGSGDKKSLSDLDETFEPWSLKKVGILTKFTTSEKLSITTSFLSSTDKERGNIDIHTYFVKRKPVITTVLCTLQLFVNEGMKECLTAPQHEKQIG